MTNSVIFKNDDNVNIKLINHSFSDRFEGRDNHEVMFRRINTYLIKNNFINGNIIDLGAWMGDNSIPWALNLSHTIYAIDPSPNNINYIEQMAEANNIKNIKTIQKAISDKNEIIGTNDDILLHQRPDLMYCIGSLKGFDFYSCMRRTQLIVCKEQTFKVALLLQN